MRVRERERERKRNEIGKKKTNDDNDNNFDFDDDDAFSWECWRLGEWMNEWIIHFINIIKWICDLTN